MDEVRVHPETLAGDPFSVAERPCACYGGWVFVGYIDEYGEERQASYRCQRCAEETSVTEGLSARSKT